MSIFVDQNTKVVYQGLTGSQGRYYGLLNRDYGTQVVAGTNPKKAGKAGDGIQHRRLQPRRRVLGHGRLDRGRRLQGGGQLGGHLRVRLHGVVQLTGLVVGELAQCRQRDEVVDPLVHAIPPRVALSRWSPPRTRPFTVPSGRPRRSAMSEWL